MLDLKKLEEKLDKVLEEETSKSLSDWLSSKRFKNVYTYLGNGQIEEVGYSYQTSSVVWSMPSNSINNAESPIDNGNEYNYQQAA